MQVSLRPFQTDAVYNIKASFREGYRAPLLVLPTGAGKTVVFCHIAEAAGARGNQVLILVHRQELLSQTSEHLTRLGVPHGLIAPGHSPTGDMLQVASVQTLVRRIGKSRINPKLIIIDEAHHSAAGTWRKILGHYSTAMLLGVTATPIRMDGSGLGLHCGGFYDRLICGPSVADLIALGYLALPIVYRPSLGVDLSGLKIRMGDYVAEDMAQVLDKPTITGCAIDHYRRICPGVPAIAFCANVKHAEHVAEQFNTAGIAAAALTGDMVDSVRKYRINALATGGIKVLTSCEIVSEGTDIPVVTACIMLRKTASLGMYLQQAGRCLRPHPDKTNSIILDHVGNFFQHGLPDDTREWTLDAPRVKRGKKDSEPTIALRQCQSCYAVFRPPLAFCPQCGAEYKTAAREIEQIDGELIKIEREEREAQQKFEKKKEQWEAKSLEDLLEVAKKRGHPTQWAHIVYNARREKERKRMQMHAPQKILGKMRAA
jgi:DNA repair protein RadD